MTLNLRNTYNGSECLLALAEQPAAETIPPTVFTEPSEGKDQQILGVSNDGLDNVENNLIMHPDDHLTSPEGEE